MSIKLVYGDATFEVTTPREAADLFRLLRSEQSRARDAKVPVAAAGSTGRTEDEKRRLTVRALITIRDGGESGVNSKQLADSLDLESTRKLAHVGNILAAFCKRHGFEVESVFRRVETRAGRTWYPGPMIDKAIRRAKNVGTKESNLL